MPLTTASIVAVNYCTAIDETYSNHTKEVLLVYYALWMNSCLFLTYQTFRSLKLLCVVSTGIWTVSANFINLLEIQFSTLFLICFFPVLVLVVCRALARLSPKSFSLGEALVLSQLFAAIFVDALYATINQVKFLLPLPPGSNKLIFIQTRVCSCSALGSRSKHSLRGGPVLNLSNELLSLCMYYTSCTV